MSSIPNLQPWIVRPQWLGFYLSDLVIYRMPYQALVLNQHFTKMDAGVLDAVPLVEHLKGAVQAAVIRSAPVSARLPKIALQPKTIRYVPSQYSRYYIDLHGTFVEYLKKFSGKTRSTLQRKVKKLCSLSGTSWREYRTPEEFTDFYELAREISRKTYQEKLLDSGLPETEEFRTRMFELAAHESALGFLLFRQNKPVAYLFCPAFDGIVLYNYVGYDPEYHDLSPGTVLQYIVLERLFSTHEFRLFDFTEGQGPQKALFATGSSQCADVFFFRRNLKNLLLVLLHAGCDAVSTKIGKLLEKLKVKVYVKRLLRR